MARSTAPNPAASHTGKNATEGETSERRAEEDAAALASYIADMASELSQLAGRAEMPMVAYFLNLARVEAETHSREIAERERAVEPEE